MKYLFLIVRHLFPRRRWQTVETHAIRRIYEDGDTRVIGHIYIQRDQFGAMRTHKVTL